MTSKRDGDKLEDDELSSIFLGIRENSFDYFILIKLIIKLLTTILVISLPIFATIIYLTFVPFVTYVPT